MATNIGTLVAGISADTKGLDKALESAKKSTEAASQAMSKSIGKMNASFNKAGKSMMSAGKSMTKYVSLPLSAIGGFAIKAGAEFESAMSQVQATMGASKSDMAQLEAAAKKMGATTAFSAKESAEALNYLALAGFNADQQVAALPKVLTLASAGGMELSAASDMLTDSMSALGLASKDTDVLMSNMNVMVDQMAKTASKSNTSVAQLGEAILTVGGTAKGLKGGTNELNQTLGLLADNGIKAAEGGTKLRNIILAMSPTTKPAIAAFKQLGLETFDAQGNMRSMSSIFGDLNAKMADMTSEEKQNILTQIFNKQDLKAVNALLGTTQERWGELGDAIADSAGAGQQMADTQLDNWKGQMTKLKNAIEGVALKISDVLLPVVKRFTVSIKGITDKLNAMSPQMTKVVVVIGGIAAAIGPVLLGLGKFMTLIPSITKGIMGIGKALKFLTTNPWGLAITAVIALSTYIIKLWKTSETFRAKVKFVAQSVSTFFQKAWIRIQQGAELMWLGIKTYFTAIPKLASVIWATIKRVMKGEKIGDAFKDELATAFTAVTDKAEEIKDKYNDQLAQIEVPNYEEILASESKKQEAKEAGDTIGEEVKTGIEEQISTVQSLSPSLGGYSFKPAKMDKMEAITPPKLEIASSVKLETDKLKQNNTALLAEAKRLQKELGKVVVDLNSMVSSSLTDAFVTIGEGFAAMMTGTGNAGDMFNNLLGIVLSFTSTLGKALIASGVGALAFEKLLLAPGAAIAAGTALVALSAVAKNLLEKGPTGGNSGGSSEISTRSGSVPVELASGGVVTGDTLARLGEYPGARFDPEVVLRASKLDNYIQSGNGTVVNMPTMPDTLKTNITADQIQLILDYRNRRNNALR